MSPEDLPYICAQTLLYPAGSESNKSGASAARSPNPGSYAVHPRSFILSFYAIQYFIPRRYNNNFNIGFAPD